MERPFFLLPLLPNPCLQPLQTRCPCRLPLTAQPGPWPPFQEEKENPEHVRVHGSVVTTASSGVAGRRPWPSDGRSRARSRWGRGADWSGACFHLPTLPGTSLHTERGRWPADSPQPCRCTQDRSGGVCVFLLSIPGSQSSPRPYLFGIPKPVTNLMAFAFFLP